MTLKSLFCATFLASSIQVMNSLRPLDGFSIPIMLIAPWVTMTLRCLFYDSSCSLSIASSCLSNDYCIHIWHQYFQSQEPVNLEASEGE